MASSSMAPADVPGKEVPAGDVALETGAGFIQDFKPVKQICAHLNAFHTYADEPGRYVEANHYCSHLTSDVRQCILYDGPGPDAKLIGIEYMVTPKVYETLPAEERKLWHSHVFEVRSGMLIMPGPTAPGAQQVWEAAETAEMKEVVHLYGKVYHLWQTDRGDALPLGEPKLMTSFTETGQFDFDKVVSDRDRRFGVDYKRKRDIRKDTVPEPKIHEDADHAWKQRRNSM
ncbi:hypothetical protein PG993_001882 [Apiospora rasikravindrae]|uniref:DUF1264 domain-containing protein n=1 Tax=Apiospora rasikravindrae TaxID=990691 RepID=A0ABR1UCR2_9PEZI